MNRRDTGGLDHTTCIVGRDAAARHDADASIGLLYQVADPVQTIYGRWSATRGEYAGKADSDRLLQSGLQRCRPIKSPV